MLEADFGRIQDQTIYSRTGNNGILHGDAKTMRTENYDGAPALYFSNGAGILPAREYVDFGVIPLEEKDFTVQLWIRTSRDGCNGWSGRTTWVEPDAEVDISSFQSSQRTRGGVLLANASFDSPRHQGFVLACMQQYLYLTSSTCGKEGGKPVQIKGLKAATDDRWHQITVTYDRKGMQSVYLDAEMAAQADISSYEGKSLDGGPVVLGADSSGVLGLGEVTVGELRLYQGLLKPEQIERRYFASAALGLAHELEKIDFAKDERFSRESVAAIRSEAERVRETALRLREDESGSSLQARTMYCCFREQYERFLLGDKRPRLRFLLFSDAHIEGSGGERQEALKAAFSWAGELDADAYVDGGDYSNFGEDEERDAYWDVAIPMLGGMKAFITPGNHETFFRAGTELKADHLAKLKKTGMVFSDHQEFYYEGERNGYHFLVLSQYNDSYVIPGRHGEWVKNGCARIDEAQLSWLEERLKSVCGQGKPVFAVIHNAVHEVITRQSGGDFPAWQEIQDGERLYEILARYPDIVLMTGHVHHGLGDCCGVCRTQAGYYVIDVPAFCGSPKGYGNSKFSGLKDKHTGYFVDVYEKGIYLRAADFAAHQWLTAYDQKISLAENGL